MDHRPQSRVWVDSALFGMSNIQNHEGTSSKTDLRISAPSDKIGELSIISAPSPPVVQRLQSNLHGSSLNPRPVSFSRGEGFSGGQENIVSTLSSISLDVPSENTIDSETKGGTGPRKARPYSAYIFRSYPRSKSKLGVLTDAFDDPPKSNNIQDYYAPRMGKLPVRKIESGAQTKSKQNQPKELKRMESRKRYDELMNLQPGMGM